MESSRTGRALLSAAAILLTVSSVSIRGQTRKSAEDRKQVPPLLSAEELFQRVSPSVFVIEALDESGSVVALGSGVAVDFLAATSSIRIVTNTHVIVDADAVRVKQGKQTWPANVEHLDVRGDLCLLEVKGLEARPVVLRESSTLTVGERVYAIGAPKGLELSLSDGLVSGIRNDPRGPVIQTSAAISSGSSGGGLFDSAGRLVGITTFFIKEAQNLNFALPPERIGNLEGQTLEETAKAWELLGTEAIEEAGRREHNLLGSFRPPPIGDGPDFQLWIEERKRRNAIQDEGRKSAVRAYRKALGLRPVNFQIWTKLGSLYADLGDEHNTANAYQQALQLKADDVSIWVSLGEAYEKLGEEGQAVRAYQRAIRLQPENASLWWHIGRPYKHLSQYKQAEGAYQEAVRLDPNNAVYLLGLGNFYVLRGKRSKAIEVYERLRIVDPKGAEMFRVLVH